MTEQIWIPFRGEGAGVGELSWGQRELWGAMQSKDSWMPMGAIAPVPAGTTVADLVDDLRFVMSSYPTLRTRLRWEADGPKQVVSAAGEVALEIVDAAPATDPAEVAEQVRRRYWDTDYDFVTEWPVRMAVVRHRGIPTHRVWVNCHLVTDATGATIMVDALKNRRGSAAAAAGIGFDPMPPLEQARWQTSPAGQRHCARVLRHCARVLRHWERLLRTIPARRFPEPATRAKPRYWNGRFISPALRLAVPAIAERLRVESATVLPTLFAMALWQVAGVHPVVTRVVVSNRFRSGLAGTISPIVHNGLCVLQVAGRPLAEAVAGVRRRAMAAYTYAYYDPPQLDALVARVSRERGEPIDLGCFFNDRRRSKPDLPPDPPGTPAQIRAALPASRLVWDERQDHSPYDPLFVSVDDTGTGLSVELFFDAHQLPPAAAESCARRIEELAVAAATAESSRPSGRRASPGG